ncbi:MAG: Transglutaminase-like enzyme, putative cysteine protease, partial [Bacteroidetes bacterium]|nr:Transglutaminase-like enzyme, putative cysteine protease [Bacteroidota bacterium]
NDVYFQDEDAPSEEKGYLRLFSSESHPVPEYYMHFTIARFENGRYNTLEYDYNKRITDFKEELAVTPGHYMIVTGNRLSDKKILSNISFYDLYPGQHLSIEIKLRKDTTDSEISGIIYRR